MQQKYNGSLHAPPGSGDSPPPTTWGYPVDDDSDTGMTTASPRSRALGDYRLSPPTSTVTRSGGAATLPLARPCYSQDNRSHGHRLRRHPPASVGRRDAILGGR